MIRLITIVGEGGLEPPRPEGHWHLKPARLPFRHSPQQPGKTITHNSVLPNRADAVLRAEMEPGSTIEVTKAEIGGPNDGESEVSIRIVAPSKAKKREAVGVGAQGGTDGDEAPQAELPEEPEVLPDVPDAPPAEDSKE